MTYQLLLQMDPFILFEINGKDILLDPSNKPVKDGRRGRFSNLANYKIAIAWNIYKLVARPMFSR